MENTELTTLHANVEMSITKLIEDRRLKWLADTLEFKEGILIGLEIAGIYGDAICKMYNSGD